VQALLLSSICSSKAARLLYLFLLFRILWITLFPPEIYVSLGVSGNLRLKYQNEFRFSNIQSVAILF
jgi:hypothetical protein